MSAEAREAVAAAIQLEAPGRCPMHMAQHLADAALAALRPFIAAEIRAWAESERNGWSTGRGTTAALIADADAIADRITTTRETR